MREGRRGLGRKLIWATLLLLTAVLAGAGFYNLRQQRGMLDELVTMQGNALCAMSAVFCTEPLLASDYPVLETYTAALAHRKNNVSFVVVRRADDTVVAASPAGRWEELLRSGACRVFASPVRVGGPDVAPVGSVTLGISTARFERQVAGYTRTVLAQLLIAFLVLAVALPLIIDRGIAQPLRALDRRAAELGEGDLDTPVLLGRDDEFGRLAETLDMMRRRLRATYVELSMRNEELRDLDRLKSEFMANMSHELRTPLNGVLGTSNLLQTTELDEEQRRLSQTIDRSARHLLAIIDQILDFAKLEAGRLEIEAIEFDPHELAEEVVGMFSAKCQQRRLDLFCEISPEVPSAVIGDPMRTTQVLTNLAANAVKFTDRGQIVVRVGSERAEDGAEMLRFEVEDTGIGISDSAIPRLFDPFTQADGSTTRKYGGTGLGLSISNRLVELMGGEIGIESTPGSGSTFWFTIRVSSASSPSVQEVSAHLQGSRILLVDRNASYQMALRNTLTAWGLRCETELAGAGALARIAEAGRAGRPFALAIVDAHLEDLEGADFLRELHDAAGGSAPPVVMVTRVAERGLRDGLLAAGAAVVVSRPLRRDDLRRSVLTVLDPASLAEPRAPLEPPAPAGGRRAEILVVEDNDVNRLVVAKMLDKLGYAHRVALHGAEAVEAVKERRFDLILMDCQMPVMDGYEAVARIRELEGDRHTPIVAMTANAMPADRERCFTAGMDDYLAKPVSLERLGDVLAHWTAAEGAEDAASRS